MCLLSPFLGIHASNKRALMTLMLRGSSNPPFDPLFFIVLPTLWFNLIVPHQWCWTDHRSAAAPAASPSLGPPVMIFSKISMPYRRNCFGSPIPCKARFQNFCLRSPTSHQLTAYSPLQLSEALIHALGTADAHERLFPPCLCCFQESV